MLFHDPLDKISWDSIRLFCQQEIRESTFIDYKKDFPRDLDKIISSMANTLGGIILIGVDANKTTNSPNPNFTGINLVDGLSERVTSVVLGNITPPLMPEVKVCENHNSTMAVVFIRVPQSHMTPHAISSNSKVYIRTNDLSNPEKLATVDEIQWLMNMRKKSEDLKQNIHLLAVKRYEIYRARIGAFLKEKHHPYSEKDNSTLCLTLCPVFPKEWFKNPYELSNAIDKYYTRDMYGTADKFPFSEQAITGEKVNILQDAVCMLSEINNGERIFYTEFNSFGLLFFKQRLELKVTNPTTQSEIEAYHKYIELYEVLSRIKTMIISGHQFYNDLGYWGYVEFKIKLEGILNSGLSIEIDTIRYKNGFCPDSSLYFEKEMLVGNMITDLDNTLIEVTQRIGWLFGYENLGRTIIDVFQEK